MNVIVVVRGLSTVAAPFLLQSGAYEGLLPRASTVQFDYGATSPGPEPTSGILYTLEKPRLVLGEAAELNQLHLVAVVLFLPPGVQVYCRVTQFPKPGSQFGESVHGIDLLGRNSLDVFHQFVEIGVVAVG